MPTTISVKPNEGGTIAITFAFADEDGNAVVPNNVSWSLMRRDRTIINNRQGVVVSPAATVTIILSGADLALGAEADPGNRVLSVYADYDSTLGTGLPLNDEAYFSIMGLIGVPQHE